MLSAILFDLDGTLVDTVGIYKKVFYGCFDHFGLHTIDERDFFSVFQRNSSLIEYLDHFGISHKNEPAFRKMRDEKLFRLFSNESQWLGGAETAINRLSGRFHLGLVTGARKKNVDAIDSKLGFRKFFKTIITVEDVGDRKKPNSFGLMLAARQLKVDPDKCLYVGDFSNDVLAAQAAGMKSCFVVSDTHQLEEGLSSDFQIEDISELAGIIDKF